jgi:hypothetical protein
MSGFLLGDYWAESPSSGKKRGLWREKMKKLQFLPP